MTSRTIAFSTCLLALDVTAFGCAPADETADTEPQAEATAEAQEPGPAEAYEPEPGETRIQNLRMLTFAGENAEAYFSSDGQQLIFQRHGAGEYDCDQIFTMTASGGEKQLVSTGTGRTTCAYFFPSGDRIVYSSTHEVGAECPAPPDYSRGYVWALYDYDIYVANPDGSTPEVLFSSPGYDAEATISQDGSKIVFTSVANGDLDIYTMNADGTDIRQLTDEPGYDGGPFFSADGTKIVYRAHHPTDPGELADYQALLADGLVRPGVLEIWVMDADGSNKRQLTDHGAASFAPFFHPSGEQIIFASNLHEPTGRNFDLYLINIDGTGLERVTTFDDFDSFPMFSPDGSKLVFGSNRHQREAGSTNVFIADWVDEPQTP